MALTFSFTQTGNKHFAEVIGSGAPKFLIGRKVSFDGGVGLDNLSTPAGLVYRPEDYKDEFKFWAHFIQPTAQGESKGSFICLNTYDRAKFTFAFMQFAAHVANGDFVGFLKKLLALPNATDYFPKLVLQDDRVHFRNTDGTLTKLESSTSTQGLMDYLNPTLGAVEQQELICSARMVHWATNDAAHRRIQVELSIKLFKENMKAHAVTYNLDGFPDKVCLLVCDIRHQGRASKPDIIAALNTNGDFDKAFERLMLLGLPKYEERINTLRTEIKKLEDAGIFGKKYKQSINDFV